MSRIDRRAAVKQPSELMIGETMQRAGMPNPRVNFPAGDGYAVPFSPSRGGLGDLLGGRLPRILGNRLYLFWGYLHSDGRSIPEINREASARGTPRLGEKMPMFAGRRSGRGSMSRLSLKDETLADLNEVESVFCLIRDLREEAGTGTNGAKPG